MIVLEKVCKEITNNGINSSILKDIDLHIGKGEFISICGPSGAGKSTLLYVMSGLLDVTNGEIIINGQNFRDLKLRQRDKFRFSNMGFVFQNFNLLPMLTVKDNIEIACKMNKCFNNETAKKTLELIELVGLLGKEDVLVSHLSGGQQQRVAIARALIHNPPIIFADEPTGNLDSVNRLNIMNLFWDINKKYGTTIIQVTHDSDVSTKNTRVITLSDGKIIY